MPMHDVETPVRHVTEPCPPEVSFRFRDGTTARSLLDLRDRLRNADPDLVDHHREHFHHWIRDVVGDVGLSERFRAFGRSGASADELGRTFAGLLETRVRSLQSASPLPPRPAAPVRRRVG